MCSYYWHPSKIACVLVTHLPAKAEIGRNPHLCKKPFIILTQGPQGKEVLDFTKVKGVMIGMPAQQAISRTPSTTFIEADEAYYDKIFDKMVGALLNFSPFIEKSESGCAYIAIDRPDWGYGNDDDIMSVLLGAIPHEFNPRVSLGSSKFLSYISAITSAGGQVRKVPDDIKEFLRKISINVLPLSWDNRTRLHSLGLHTLGQLSEIPIGAMQAQFGVEGRLAWELASGIDKSPFTPSKNRNITSDFLTFPVPASSLFPILSAVELLLDRIFRNPFIRGKELRSVNVQANIENRAPWSKKIVFRTPLHNKETVLLAIRHSLESTDIPGPLEDLRMTVWETAHASGLQSSFLVHSHRSYQLQNTLSQLELRLRLKPPIYRIREMEPWSRIPERRQSLVEYVP